MSILAEMSVDNPEYSKWVELPCTVEQLNEKMSPWAPKDATVDFLKLSHCDITVTIDCFIHLKDDRSVKEMNELAYTLLGVPGGELATLAAIFEWEHLHTRGCQRTWDRLGELVRDLPNFVHYTRAYNEYDVGFTVAHKLGLLKGLPDEVVNNFPYEQLGETHMGDGEFTHYGFVGHWDKVMYDVKKGEEWEDKC